MSLAQLILHRLHVIIHRLTVAIFEWIIVTSKTPVLLSFRSCVIPHKPADPNIAVSNRPRVRLQGKRLLGRVG
jgi:hypothetical protein